MFSRMLPVNCRVAHIDVGAGHVDFGAKAAGTFLELTLAHSARVYIYLYLYLYTYMHLCTENLLCAKSGQCASILARQHPRIFFRCVIAHSVRMWMCVCIYCVPFYAYFCMYVCMLDIHMYCDLQNDCKFDRPLKNAWMCGIPIQGPFFIQLRSRN
jgi:hypothetical protein